METRYLNFINFRDINFKKLIKEQALSRWGIFLNFTSIEFSFNVEFTVSLKKNYNEHACHFVYHIFNQADNSSVVKSTLIEIKFEKIIQGSAYLNRWNYCGDFYMVKV